MSAILTLTPLTEAMWGLGDSLEIDVLGDPLHIRPLVGSLAGPGAIRITQQNGVVTQVPNSEQGLINALKEAASSGNLITQLLITNHGKSDVMDLGNGSRFLSVYNNHIYDNFTKHNFTKDLTALFKAGMAPDRTIWLQGCDTAFGVNSLAKNFSLALPGIIVYGGDLPLVRIAFLPNQAFGLFSAFLNGRWIYTIPA